MEMQSIRATILSCLGILGGSLTVFSNLETLIKFSEWANFLSNNWGKFLQWIWDLVFFYVNLKLHIFAKFQITMACAMVLMAVGALFYEKINQREKKLWKVKLSNILRWNVVIAVLVFCFSIYFGNYLIDQFKITFNSVIEFYIFEAVFYTIYGVSIFIGLLHWPKKSAIIATISAVLFSYIFQTAASNLESSNLQLDNFSVIFGSIFSIIAALLTLFIAPPKHFAQRLLYLIMVIGILVGLNALSLLDLNLLAPS